MQKAFRQIYLDCNATTPVLPEAAEAALETMRSLYGNPSSSHLSGLQAKAALESARRAAARALAAHPTEITFTSGATEAIQTAVFSALLSIRDASPPTAEPALVLCGSTEHKAVPEAIEHWITTLGVRAHVEKIPVDREGKLDLAWLREKLPRARLLATMAVNNETGAIAPLSEIAKLLASLPSGARPLWLVDGVQALGKIPLPMDQLPIDYATFSGHKLYAPKGVGFLYVRRLAPLTPLMVGGGQERGARSGTENLPGVSAFGRILEGLKPLFRSDSELMSFRDRLVAGLRELFPKIVFNTPLGHAVPTTINFSVPGIASKEILDLFDSAGIRVSAGSACSSAQAKPSYVLEAMGLEPWRAASAVRLSFGPATRAEEIDEALRALREIGRALRGSCILSAGGDFSAPKEPVDGVIQFREGPSNTWIVCDRESKLAVLIDPTESTAERIEQLIECQDLRVAAILDTHSHADHESVRPALSKLLSDRIVGTARLDPLGWPIEGTSPVRLADGTEASSITIGARRLVRAPTPGHTSDSVTFLLGAVDAKGALARESVEFAFCGDLILSGGLGRTDFETSDSRALFHSLRKLHSLVGERAVFCPAHDYNNSFGFNWLSEKNENELLRLALRSEEARGLDDFVAAKERIDRELGALEADFQGTVCGVTAAKTPDSALSLPWNELLSRIQRSSTLRVFDIREPHEHAVFGDWPSVGLGTAPENIPLSRFVNLMRDWLSSGGRPAVLICRSGSRSLQAVRALRRLGLNDVWSLEGGIASGLPVDGSRKPASQTSAHSR